MRDPIILGADLFCPTPGTRRGLTEQYHRFAAYEAGA